MSPNLSKKDIIQAILTNPQLSDEEKSLLVEEFINEIKKEYPELKYHATKSDLKETELKLTKEIEDVRKEIKEIELKLSKEIEDVRKEIKEIELKLSKEIEDVRKEIKEIELKLSKDIKETKFSMLKWQFIFWISQIGVILAIAYKFIHFKIGG